MGFPPFVRTRAALETVPRGRPALFLVAGEGKILGCKSVISQNLTFFRRVQLVLDLGLTALAYYLTFWLRSGVPFAPVYRTLPEPLFRQTLVLILMVWAVLLLL